MAVLSLVDAVQVILRSVAHVPTAAFLSRCSGLQLEPTQLEEHDADPPGFPQYDASHTFVFKTDDKAPAAPLPHAGELQRYAKVRIALQRCFGRLTRTMLPAAWRCVRS